MIKQNPVTVSTAASEPLVQGVSATGCNSARVDWTAPLDNGGAPVSQYRIEWFREAPVAPFYEVAEVQRVSVSASDPDDLVAGGSFTIATAGFDLELPGTVALQDGSGTMTTSTDLTHFLRRGDEVLIRPSASVVGTGAARYAILTIGDETDGLLAAGSLPLQAIYTSVATELVGTGLRAYVRYATVPLAVNSTAAMVQSALEALPSVDLVEVSSTNTSSSRDWFVTFSNTVANVSALVVNGEAFVGATAAAVSRGVTVREAVAPVAFGSAVVSAAQAAADAQATSGVPSAGQGAFSIVGLHVGTEYTVRVGAINEQGLGTFGPSASSADGEYSATIVPVCKPSAPPAGSVRLLPFSNTALEVEFDETADAGGLSLTSHDVQYTSHPVFTSGFAPSAADSAMKGIVNVAVTHARQVIKVDATQLPLEGTFSIAAGGFRGSLTSRVGSGRLGSNDALKATLSNSSEAQLVIAGDDARDEFFPGEFIRIGAPGASAVLYPVELTVYRVCAASTGRIVDYDSTDTTVPLCAAHDATLSVGFGGLPGDIVSQPVYRADTLIGEGVVQTDNFTLLATVNMTGTYECGDEIALGPDAESDPELYIYRLSEEFCDRNTDGVLHLDRAFRGPVSAENGTFTIYRRQTTEAIDWNANAATVARELESLSTVSTVRVSRAASGNGFEWDVSFTSSQDASPYAMAESSSAAAAGVVAPMAAVSAPGAL